MITNITKIAFVFYVVLGFLTSIVLAAPPGKIPLYCALMLTMLVPLFTLPRAYKLIAVALIALPALLAVQNYSDGLKRKAMMQKAREQAETANVPFFPQR